jgi:cytochrome P450
MTSTPAPAPLPYPFSEPNLLQLDPTYARLRASGRLGRVVLPGGDQAWLCTRYADVRRILTDPAFSLVPPPGSAASSAPEPSGPTTSSSLNRIANASLKPSQVERLRGPARQKADALLDALSAKGTGADLLTDYVKPLALAVNTDLLRVPPGADESFQNSLAAAAFTARRDPRQAKQERAGLRRYLKALLIMREREGATADDLLSTMMRARGTEADRHTDSQLADLAIRLLVPGLQNSVLMMSNFISVLIQHPGELAHLREHPELTPAAVEELIRYTPFHSTSSFPRYPLQDVELGGTLVRAGETVIGALCAANRDGDVFGAPDELDLERSENAHVGFGLGAHYCPGASLARMQVQVAIAAIARKTDGGCAVGDLGCRA